MKPTQPETVGPAILAGGGEMGRLSRLRDWAATPVGPVDVWPQSLRTTIGLMLNSRYPTFLAWGRELTFFYNDAYIPVLGTRHPDALGRPAAAVWPEIWSTLGPQAEGVLKEGRASWREDQQLLLERNQYLEETYFTYSFSPIPDDEGGIGGVFCACTENTHRVLSQRRLRTLRALSDRAGGAKTVEAACEAASLTLAANRHDLPFALLYLLYRGGRRAKLAGCMGVREHAQAGATVDVGGPNELWPFSQAMTTGTRAELHNIADRIAPIQGGAWPEPPQQAVVVPMARAGQNQVAGFLVAGVSPRLALDQDYRGFFDSVADHIARAIANARAYEEEHERADALTEIDRVKTAFFSNISHEFRTPLTLMLGPIEESLAEVRNQAERERLELVHRNALRLQKLVTTLLEFSEIEAGRIHASYEPAGIAGGTVDFAGLSENRQYRRRGDEVELMRELTSRVYLRLEHARAQEALRESEERLRRANEELEERVIARTRELEQTNVALTSEVRERGAAEERVKSLLRQIVDAQEEERRRIARDLHDQLGQQLTALRLNLDSLKSTSGEAPALRDQIDHIEQIAARLDREVDFLAHELRPAALDDLGLPATLGEFVREWSKQSNISAEFHTRGLESIRLAPEIETNLYRISQEALNNVYKHAGASRVSVMLERRDGRAVLIVEDDGGGFDARAVADCDERGLGLVGMRERAALVRGTLEIETAPGEGTTVFVRVPL